MSGNGRVDPSQFSRLSPADLEEVRAYLDDLVSTQGSSAGSTERAVQRALLAIAAYGLARILIGVDPRGELRDVELEVLDNLVDEAIRRGKR